MSLENKVAIVTGSYSGIGRAIALELARQGAAVTINYHKGEDAANAAKAEIEAAGGKARSSGRTSRSVADIQKLVDGTVAAFGRLDILVNNAGMETRTSTLDTTERQFDMVIAIDLKSAFFGVQLAAKQMIAQGGGGRIINISSIHEDWPMPGNSPYCLAKGGVRMLTRTAGVELAPHGITVVGVAPGRGPHPDRRGHAVRPGREGQARERHPARPRRRAAGDRQLRRVPRIGCGLVRHRRDLHGRRRDDAGERRAVGRAMTVARRRPTLGPWSGAARRARPGAGIADPLGADRRRRRRQLLRLREARDRHRHPALRRAQTTPHRRGSSRSTRRSTGPASTGTCSCRDPPGQLYNYVAHGPSAPDEGLRFDPTKVLLDPYGRGVAVPGGLPAARRRRRRRHGRPR